MEFKNAKNGFVVISIIMAQFTSSMGYSQALKDISKSTFKSCEHMGTGFWECKVCDDKDMKLNCKTYWCTGEGTNCVDKPKKNTSSVATQFENPGKQIKNTDLQTSPQTNLASANQIQSSKLIIKKIGNTSVQTVSSSLFKDGLNVINIASGVKFLIQYKANKITKLIFLKPDGKEINVVNINPLAYNCDGPICECIEGDDCEAMFESGKCGYSSCIDGKCYCLTIVN